MKRIILASTSPRRIACLKKIKVPFTAFDSGFIETPYVEGDTEEFIISQTVGKAHSASKRFPYAIIISGDCGVMIDDHVLGKPTDAEDAKRMLQLLSGKTHTILTGYAVYDPQNNKIVQGVEKVFVTFKNLSEKEIDDYIKEGDCFDKAGSYAIQTVKDRFTTKIEGDWDSALGFATEKVVSALKELLPELKISEK